MKYNNIKILIQDKDIGNRLDKILSKKIEGVSRNRIQDLILKKNVYFDSTLIENQSFKISKPGVIIISIPPVKKLEIKSQKIKLDVVYEDKDLIVINKPAGMVVHPGAGNYENTLVNALLHHCKFSLSGIGGVERPGIVHRIDKMTSGLLVAAKNDLTHRNLSAQFKNRTIKRVYEAIVCNKLDINKGEIRKNIIRSKLNRKIMTTISDKKGRTAVTMYEIKKEYKITNNFFLNHISCILKTGRTHQIRVHMKYMGNPILGDISYGKKLIFNKKEVNDELVSIINKDWYETRRHALHAKTLGFIHPRSESQLFFRSDLPDDFNRLIRSLNKKENIFF